MADRDMSEVGRVRSLYIDLQDEKFVPRRGDRIETSRTVYYVLYARRVRRRDPSALTRIQMNVIRAQDMPVGLRERLIQSALRGHQCSRSFPFFWYPRTKRRISFEQYIHPSR